MRLDKASTAYGMEIGAEKTKLITNYTRGISKKTKVNRQKLETVTSFKYLGSVITDKGSKSEILSRTAQTTAVLKRLKTSLARQEYFSQFQDTTEALPCHIHLPVYYTSHAKTTLLMRKSVPRFSRQSDHTKIS